MLRSRRRRMRRVGMGAAASTVFLVGAEAPSRRRSATSCRSPPPLDQGDTGLCWVFAPLSMLETNYMTRHPGAHVAFSRAALQRNLIDDRFDRLIRGEPGSRATAALRSRRWRSSASTGSSTAPTSTTSGTSKRIFDVLEQSLAERTRSGERGTGARRPAEERTRRQARKDPSRRPAGHPGGACGRRARRRELDGIRPRPRRRQGMGTLARSRARPTRWSATRGSSADRPRSTGRWRGRGGGRRHGRPRLSRLRRGLRREGRADLLSRQGQPRALPLPRRARWRCIAS